MMQRGFFQNMKVSDNNSVLPVTQIMWMKR